MASLFSACTGLCRWRRGGFNTPQTVSYRRSGDSHRLSAGRGMPGLEASLRARPEGSDGANAAVCSVPGLKTAACSLSILVPLELTQGKLFSRGLNLVQGAWTLCHSLSLTSSKQVQSKVNSWGPIHPPSLPICGEVTWALGLCPSHGELGQVGTSPVPEVIGRRSWYDSHLGL